ncbi:MAG: hypothetical protein IH596_04375 [Bacteroidales bacterium]|nr:hypothetical protein [Bacteroidales bacterium]
MKIFFSIRRKFHLLVLLYLTSCSIFGQNAPLEENQFNIFQWPKEVGLPNTIQSMAQSPDGYLWMGCDYGIVRFDGFQVTLFERHSVPELVQDDCQAICIASDSTLYFGMVGGLVVSYKNGNFDQIGDSETFQGYSITRICEDLSGHLWIGTNRGGIYRLSGDKFKRFTTDDGLPGNGIDAICAGNSGEVWVGTGQGLCRIKDKKIERFGIQDGLSFSGIAALFMDREGTLWIGGFKGEFMTYSQGKFAPVKSGRFPLKSSFRLISEGPDGNLWIGTDSEGLIVFDRDDSSTIDITPANGLSGNIIKCLVTDNEGDILVCPESGGLNRIRQPILNKYTTKEGLPENFVTGLYISGDDKIWISFADASVFFFENGRFQNMSDKFNIKVPPVWSIYGGPGSNIWTAGKEGLISYDGRQRQVFTGNQKLSNTLFHAVYTSRNGTVWAGTDAGIYLIGPEGVSTISKEDGLTDGRIYCFLEDSDGRMWIGTQDGGINLFENGKISSITTRDGLSDNLILCFYEDSEGFMWVGTGHDGLNRIDQKSGKVNQVNAAIGYPRTISYITEDLSGHLWIGTTDGIISFQRADVNEFIEGKRGPVETDKFGTAEGMSGNTCSSGTFPGGCWTPDNKIWFATEAGITEVDPAIVSIPVNFPKVFIQDVLVNGKSETSMDRYDLPAGVIQLEIRYCAPSFIAPERLKFRYRLEGYDNAWIDAGSRRSAFYTKVPAGNYTFRVQVSNHQGQWSDQEASVKIHVNYFFYQTTWFLLLCILLGFLVIYAIIRYRLRYIREKELEILVDARTSELRELNRELDKRVLDRTVELAAANQELEAFTYSVSHDLRAPVRRIEGLVEALIEEHAEQLDETGNDFLNKVADSSTEMGQLIEEFLKLARIARQEIDKTELNLSSMVNEILKELAEADPERNVTVKTDPNVSANGDSRLIHIALQNLLGNAWKYTGKKDHPEIIFGCREKGGQKVYFIQDNGVGFDMAHYEKLFTPFLRLHSDDQFTGTGIGLATVKRIILKHGGAIWAEAEPGKGSTFFFTL